MLKRIKATYQDYPRNFWILMSGIFVDRLGGSLVYPFFALYITAHFQVGMTQVGVLFGIFTITNVIGSFIGGALADKIGRKQMMLVGLVLSGLSSLILVFVNDLNLFYVVGAFIGLVDNLGTAASHAMIADMLPEEQRTEGFGILRVTVNIAIVIGPILGGFMAAYSYSLLFIGDALTSVIMALIVYYVIPETKPANDDGQPEESTAQAFRGYRRVIRDGVFMAFFAGTLLWASMYRQMHIALPVYMRDYVGLLTSDYGLILSLNAAMVVALQFWITRRIAHLPSMSMMIAGVGLMGLGFTLFGFAHSLAFFALAMAIMTLGEMIGAPVSTSLAAKLAPPDMRGRYLAVFSFRWSLPNLFIPYLVGIVMDQYNGVWVWYTCGFFALISMLVFHILRSRSGERLNLQAAKSTA